MYHDIGLPSVTVRDVAHKLAQNAPFILLDVREEPELPMANLGDWVTHVPLILLDVREEPELPMANLGDWVTHVPLSALAEFGLEALPETVLAAKDAEIVVMCHHGIRSAQVTAWLRQQGWTRVYNMAGGIEAYATAVDPTIGHY